jgi:hypothetical protein
MNVYRSRKMAIMTAGTLVGASTTWADTLPTHRIPAALAVEAASETVAACAKQGYHETAAVLDADGATIGFPATQTRSVDGYQQSSQRTGEWSV